MGAYKNIYYSLDMSVIFFSFTREKLDIIISAIYVIGITQYKTAPSTTLNQH